MFSTLLVRSKMLVLAGAAVAGLTFAAGPASAHTNWSFGISFLVPAAPVYYAPAPQPVYYAPPVQYAPAPVCVAPPEIYYAPPVTYYAPAAPYVVFGGRNHERWEHGRMDRERFEHGGYGRR